MASSLDDPYMGPHGVLANILGLKRPAILHAYEHAHATRRLAQLIETPITGGFDMAHLCAIHAYVFQDVYAWAGEPRIVNLSKAGTTFERASNIEARAAQLSQALKADGYLQGLGKEAFVDGFTRHYAAWNALHPFREGNGRSTRIFFAQLADQAGYTLDRQRIERDRGEWNSASREAMTGNLAPLRQIFAEALRPARSIAFEQLPRDEALTRHPELAPYFTRLDQLIAKVAAQFPGNNKAVEVYTTQGRSEIVRMLDAGGPGRERQAPLPHRGLER